MDEEKWLAERFEAHRDHLQRGRLPHARLDGRGRRRGPGSLAAAQPRRRRRHRQPRRLADHGGRPRLPRHAALAQVAARGAARGRRREPAAGHERAVDPEREAELADSVGLALLVVLETLAPAERLAFVLHDMFDLPFEEIAPDRRPLADGGAAARQPGPPARAGGAKTPERRPSPASARSSTPSSAAPRSGDFAGLAGRARSRRRPAGRPRRRAAGRRGGAARRRGRGRQLQGQGAGSRGRRWSMARWASSWRRRAACCWCST